jgi:hypothetical protein
MSSTESPGATPFRACSLGALRLLVGYALLSDDTREVRPLLLEHARAQGLPPCQALLQVVAASRSRECVSGVLDAVLAAASSRVAACPRGRSVAALAERWCDEGADLAGAELAALLWRVARENGPAWRALERKICRVATLERLLPRPAAWL